MMLMQVGVLMKLLIFIFIIASHSLSYAGSYNDLDAQKIIVEGEIIKSHPLKSLKNLEDPSRYGDQHDLDLWVKFKKRIYYCSIYKQNWSSQQLEVINPTGDQLQSIGMVCWDLPKER